jgi:hypothetical protein
MYIGVGFERSNLKSTYEIGILEFEQAPKLFVGLERRNLKWK